MNPAPDFQTVFQSFNELASAELYQILQARSQVFVVEQHCPYLDIDGLDKACWHGQMRDDDNGLVAYCRIVPPITSAEGETALPAIGRVLVISEHRGQGLARKLMHCAIDFCQRTYPKQAIIISAQLYLADFYQSLGFQTISEPYDEDGIEHVDMVLKQTKPAFESV